MRVIEQFQVLEFDRSGNIWLSLSILDVSPNQGTEGGVRSQLLNYRTGEVFPLPTPEVSSLSSREREILRLISRGKLSVNTHRQHILEKLNADNSMEAVRYAWPGFTHLIRTKRKRRATAIGRAADRKTSLCEPHPGSLLPGKSARIDEKEPLSFHYRAYKKSVTARFLELLRFFLQESPLNLPAHIQLPESVRLTRTTAAAREI